MILVGGENLIDFIQIKGDNGAPVYQANVGGSPFNTAKALARQGISVGYMTPISNDTLGDLLANNLLAQGVSLLAPRRVEPTSLAVVSVNNGTPSYQFYRENTAERMVTMDALQRQIPEAGATAFQLGSLAITDGADADVWADFYVRMKLDGLFTSLDPNIRAAFIKDRATFLTRLERLLMHTDLLKLSDEDLEWIYPDETLFEAAKRLRQKSSAKLVVVTRGADGAFALFEGRTISIKAATVDGLVDTVGAGDTFMSTLIAGLSQSGRLSGDAIATMTDIDVELLLQRASCAAALNCEAAGCNPPKPEEIDAALVAKVP